VQSSTKPRAPEAAAYDRWKGVVAYPVQVSTPSALCLQDDRFVHEAVFYEGEDDFAAQTVPFILDGIAAGERTLVAVGEGRNLRLRAELGSHADQVQFVDMETLGRNPARIISAWHDFVAAHGGAGRPLRGIGEPIWPGRSEPELAECHRHEALLNVAFDDGPPWWLLCPYDTSALSDNVLAEARRTHPLVREQGEALPSPGFPSPLASEPFHGVLPEPSEPTQELVFGARDLGAVRRRVAESAQIGRLDRTRADELVLCVSELAANSVLHGGGTGVLRTWIEGTAVACEVRDRGALRDPLTGRIRPAIGAHGGRGVWFANTMCDLVQIRSQADGTVVRGHVHRSPV
jgi:anti-sigma regulatory factor (Ser/Thr protein kinase)